MDNIIMEHKPSSEWASVNQVYGKCSRSSSSSPIANTTHFPLMTDTQLYAYCRTLIRDQIYHNVAQKLFVINFLDSAFILGTMAMTTCLPFPTTMTTFEERQSFYIGILSLLMLIGGIFLVMRSSSRCRQLYMPLPSDSSQRANTNKNTMMAKGGMLAWISHIGLRFVLASLSSILVRGWAWMQTSVQPSQSAPVAIFGSMVFLLFYIALSNYFVHQDRVASSVSLSIITSMKTGLAILGSLLLTAVAWMSYMHLDTLQFGNIPVLDNYVMLMTIIGLLFLSKINYSASMEMADYAVFKYLEGSSHIEWDEDMEMLEEMEKENGEFVAAVQKFARFFGWKRMLQLYFA